jgi:hypothetical protein
MQGTQLPPVVLSTASALVHLPGTPVASSQVSPVKFRLWACLPPLSPCAACYMNKKNNLKK